MLPIKPPTWVDDVIEGAPDVEGGVPLLNGEGEGGTCNWAASPSGSSRLYEIEDSLTDEFELRPDSRHATLQNSIDLVIPIK